MRYLFNIIRRLFFNFHNLILGCKKYVPRTTFLLASFFVVCLFLFVYSNFPLYVIFCSIVVLISFFGFFFMFF